MAEKTNNLLFVSGRDASSSAVAAAFAAARQHPGIGVHHAAALSGAVSPLVWRVLSEFHLAPAQEDGLVLPKLGRLVPDVVVSLSEEAEAASALVAGNPQQLRWRVGDFYASRGDADTQLRFLRELCGAIKRLVDDFFEQGYLDSFLLAKRTSDLVLDQISEGVIAHDLNRRILYFNTAAERITGFKREEVLNQDCRTVMPGGLCGPKCLFCGGSKAPGRPVDHEIEITTAGGEHRRVAMTINPMRDRAGVDIGILGCFRDISRDLERARRLDESEQFAGIVGRDPKMVALYDLIPELAHSNAPVLIQGESGTGKELVAAALHTEGPRAGKMFVPVNCGALPEGLLESELFGHVKGAFTGAVRDKKGRFELADGGTIFLDEIGDISPAMQVKLLRVLQEGCFERVGGEHTIKVNVRVISATHRDLQKEMAVGKFREDLFYRLSVVPLIVPPLRERPTDIPLLASHFLKRLAAERDLAFSPEALEFMLGYGWPGNVRELQNWIQFALIKCKTGQILPEHLPPVALKRVVPAPVAGATPDGAPKGRQHLTKELVEDAISRAHGNKVEAARLLGISRATLYRFLDDLAGVAS